MKPLFESWRQYITEGLTKTRQHVFKKLKSGNWGKVSRSEGKTEESDLVVEPNTKGFPYDDYKERQEYLNKMAKD
jgi:hypothetical protein